MNITTFLSMLTFRTDWPDHRGPYRAPVPLPQPRPGRHDHETPGAIERALAQRILHRRPRNIPGSLGTLSHVLHRALAV